MRARVSIPATRRLCRSFSILFALWILAAGTAYCNDYFVAPDGNDSGDGSIDHPLATIPEAVSRVSDGNTIYLRGGTYSYDNKIGISKSGTSDSFITIQNYQNELVILDFSSEPYGGSYRGISLSGSYWHFKGINIKGAGDNGMNVSGSNNIIELCSFYENCDTGLQLGGGASNNQVINCDSYYNYDYLSSTPGGNADGFAPKLDVGTGNYFYGCRAWQNSDDGYDGYLRPSDDVNTTYENCWAFKNGYLADGSVSQGNGNGFKMGGSDDKTLRHNVIYKNCLCFDNQVKGFDQNNDKGSMTLYNCTSLDNGSYNYSIPYAPASGKTATVTNCVSYGSSGVHFDSSVDQTTDSWQSPFVVTSADFVSVDASAAYGPREPDGSLPKISFMRLEPDSDLIDGGTYVGLDFVGAPDLGAFEYIPGDCHSDGSVNMKDLECFVANWLDTGCGTCNEANFDNYGGVDFYDFAMLAENWLKY
jgi:hypothetical protein